MNQDDEIRRGDKANLVLSNEIYIEAWQGVRDTLIRKWEACPIRDKEGQHELKLMLKLLTDVRRNIETVMQTGQMAKIEIERESIFRQTVNRFKG